MVIVWILLADIEEDSPRTRSEDGVERARRRDGNVGDSMQGRGNPTWTHARMLCVSLFLTI